MVKARLRKAANGAAFYNIFSENGGIHND